MENYITLNKLIYRAWESIRGDISDDDTMDERILEHDIVIAREVLSRQDLNRKGRSIDNYIKQRISNIPMQEVRGSIDYIGYNQKHFLRSVDKIPRLIELSYRTAISSITIGFDDKYNVSICDFNNAAFVGSGRFNTSMDFAFIHEEYLYIYNPYVSGLIESGEVNGYIEYYTAQFSNSLATRNSNYNNLPSSSIPPITKKEITNLVLDLKDESDVKEESALVVVSYVNESGETITERGYSDSSGNVSLPVLSNTEVQYTITQDGKDTYTGTTMVVIEGSLDYNKNTDLVQYDPNQYTSTQYK